MADTVPALAAKPLWNTTTASTCLNAASRRSSSMCISMVPAMVRTEPEPTPYFATASSAAFTQLRMRGQAEIVVRRQIDDGLVIEGACALRLALEDAQLAIQALLLQ